MIEKGVGGREDIFQRQNFLYIINLMFENDKQFMQSVVSEERNS